MPLALVEYAKKTAITTGQLTNGYSVKGFNPDTSGAG
jgi:hypothetical protein